MTECVNNFRRSRKHLIREGIQLKIPIYQYAFKKFVYLEVKTVPIGHSGYNLKYWDAQLLSNNSQYLFESYKLFCNQPVTIKNNNSIIKVTNMSNSLLTSTSGTLNTKKCFDNLIFEGKELIVDLVRKFKNKELTSRKCLADNKLLLLLHGPPGTGKTSLISAIANEIGYSVLMFDVNKYRTKDNFSDVISHAIKEKSILILDEFDCILSLLNRNLKAHHEQVEILNRKISSASTKEEFDSLVTMLDKSKKDDIIDIGSLLSELDGICSTEGLVIIATTNRPDEIDPALTRPFRFRKFEMKHFSSKYVSMFIQNYYEVEDNGNYRDMMPAELADQCLTHTYEELVPLISKAHTED